MNINKLILSLVAACSSLVFAAAPESSDTILNCFEISSAPRSLEVNTSSTEIFLVLDGVELRGTARWHNEEFRFQKEDWDDAGFFSLEIKKVNGEFIAVAIEPAVSGPAHYNTSVFRCVPRIHGAASSNGG